MTNPASFDFEQWHEAFRRVISPRDGEETLRFCELVERVDGISDARVARALMASFRGNETGVLQTVTRVLGGVDLLTYYRAYLEVLPQLVEDGEGWDVDLADFPERDPTKRELEQIAELARSGPEETRTLFEQVLEDEDLDTDWAPTLLKLIRRKRRP